MSAGAGRADASGFTLLEILVAMLIMCAVLTVLLRLAATSQTAARAHADAADAQQRLRVAAGRIEADLRLAGAGPGGAPFEAGLVGVMAPILPARTGERGADAELSQFSDRITVLFAAETALPTTVATTMGGPAAPLAIDMTSPACRATPSCGFSPGDRALVIDPANGAYDLFTVASATADVLSPASPLSRAYPAGAPLVAIVHRVYYHDRAGRRLMVYDGEASDLPLVDHVVDLRFTYFADPSPTSVVAGAGLPGCGYDPGPPVVPLLPDLGGVALKALTAAQLTDGPACGVAPHRFDADLLRIRRVRVTLRVEAESAEFRGRGRAFANPGVSLGGIRHVPDQLVTFDVTPRNMNLAR